MYQWAQRDPRPWQQIDSSLWATLSNRREPNSGEIGGSNNVEGWLCSVSVQGITCNGMDHVAVEDVVVAGESGVRLTVWNDDPVDFLPDEFQAMVWTILPLAPDRSLGMAISTRQSCVWYCGGGGCTLRKACSLPQKPLFGRGRNLYHLCR